MLETVADFLAGLALFTAGGVFVYGVIQLAGMM